MEQQATVLVVEDDPDVRSLNRLFLEGEYAVEAVPDGESAVECAEEGFDVILLDRHLPDIRGDEVARDIRAAGYRGGIAMVTANPPDPGVARLPIDEYVTKPVGGTALTALVERLVTRLTAPATLQDLFAMLTRKARLETALGPSELSKSEAYADLLARIETQYRQVHALETSQERIAAFARDVLPETAEFDAGVTMAPGVGPPAGTATRPGQEL